MKANPNYTYLKKKVPQQRVTLLQGGTRSGKTYSVIYYLLWLCKDNPNAGLEIDLVRDTFTALKATAWKDFKDVLLGHELYHENNHNKTDHNYLLFGNQINYYGADNPHKIHGRSRDILWINEAHQFPPETVDQLLPRTRYRIICDYNPAIGDGHWLDKYIIDYPPLITTYRDNPHLTAAQVEDIESRKGDNYWWKVYGSGHRAPREGVIFEKWQTGQFDPGYPKAYGLDYGYFPDPSACIEVAADSKQKRLFLREHFYETELSAEQIADRLREATQGVRRALIVSDTSEPRTTAKIRAAGFQIEPAHKRQIVDDIRDLEDWTLIVDPESYNLIKELNNYTWNDKRKSVPVDDYNHLLDAMRYVWRRLTTKGRGLRRVN